MLKMDHPRGATHRQVYTCVNNGFEIYPLTMEPVEEGRSNMTVSFDPILNVPVQGADETGGTSFLLVYHYKQSGQLYVEFYPLRERAL